MPQTQKIPFIPPEIRRLVWKAAFQATIQSPGQGNGSCLLKDPHEPAPSVSGMFMNFVVPAKYRQTSGASNENRKPKQRDGHALCSLCWRPEPHGREWEQRGIVAQVGLYCWRCQKGANAVLYTNREVFNEAIEVVYTKTTFRFGYAVNLLAFIQATRSHEHSHLVKHIQLDLGFANFTGDLENLFPHLRSDAMKTAFPNLSTVTLEVAQGSWGFYLGRNRVHHFADAWKWDSLERITRVIARPFSACEGLQVEVKGLASQQLADVLAEGVRSNVWRIPTNAEEIGKAAQYEHRMANKPVFWDSPWPF